MPIETLSERPPTSSEVKEASEAARALGVALTAKGLPFAVRQNGKDVKIELSPSVGQLLLDVLSHVARGEMVTIVPYGAELSTMQAADMLNVSRPFLVKLLETGEIGFHRVGSHRRIQAEDVLAYKKRREETRRDQLERLQRLGQEFDAA